MSMTTTPRTAPPALAALLDAARTTPDLRDRTTALTALITALEDATSAARETLASTVAQRARAGEPQADLARELGLTRQRVQQLVAGHRRPTTPQERAAAVARVRTREATRAARIAEARRRHADGEPATAIAAALSVTRQTVARWVAEGGDPTAARRTAPSRFADDWDDAIITRPEHQVPSIA